MKVGPIAHDSRAVHHASALPRRCAYTCARFNQRSSRRVLQAASMPPTAVMCCEMADEARTEPQLNFTARSPSTWAREPATEGNITERRGPGRHAAPASGSSAEPYFTQIPRSYALQHFTAQLPAPPEKRRWSQRTPELLSRWQSACIHTVLAIGRLPATSVFRPPPLPPQAMAPVTITPYSHKYTPHHERAAHTYTHPPHTRVFPGDSHPRRAPLSRGDPHASGHNKSSLVTL